MNKEMFEIMVADWLADREEMSDLKVGEAYQDETGRWVADAEDAECTYILVVADGDIEIRYISTK